MRFDSIQIGAADLDAGSREYGLLLGQSGERRGEMHRFSFQRGAVELTAGAPGLRSLRFCREEGDDWPEGSEAYHGIPVRLDAAPQAPASAPGRDRVQAIDHVVIQSPDLDRAVALWRDRLGVRLALDREFPQRGLRILFFRSGGVTLEISGVLERSAAGAGPDTLWGVAYQVADLAACRERLLAASVAVSDIRPGQKKGTLVATAKSHSLGVPTLLIQPVD